MSFGKMLYTLRKKKNLSQEKLANELNTTRQAVSKWENDQSFPEMEKLIMISGLFDVSVDFLLKGESDSPGSEPAGNDKNIYSVWHTIGMICVGIAALALLYFVTGGEGHIANGIDKIILKL